MPYRRKFIVGTLAVFCLCATAYVGWWFWVADKITRELDSWRDARTTDGIRVMVANIETSGFPGKITVRLTDAAIGAETGIWALRVPQVRARVAPWNLGLVNGSLDGRILAAFAFPKFSGAYEVDAQSTTFKVDTGASAKAQMLSSGLHVRRTDAPLDVTIDDVSMSLAAGAPEQGHRLLLDADTLVVADRPFSPFGDTISRAQTTMDVLGTIPAFGKLNERLQMWSENGGVAEVRSVLIDHGDLSLRGEGTVGLSTDLQPEGAFTARIGGYAQAVDALAAGGHMSPDEARVAKAVLGLLSSSSTPGRPRVIEVPLTVQDRVLSAGPIRLLRVPEIQWD